MMSNEYFTRTFNIMFKIQSFVTPLESWKYIKFYGAQGFERLIEFVLVFCFLQMFKFGSFCMRFWAWPGIFFFFQRARHTKDTPCRLEIGIFGVRIIQMVTRNWCPLFKTCHVFALAPVFLPDPSLPSFKVSPPMFWNIKNNNLKIYAHNVCAPAMGTTSNAESFFANQ